MSLSDYQETHSWRGAIELGPHIVKVAEQLPAVEQATGLGQQLRQLMVELPGVIAIDLLDGGKHRLHVALRLVAALELIERIYPALDTSDARGALDTLVKRLDSDAFTERTTPASPQVMLPGVISDLPNQGETPAPAPTEEPAPTPKPAADVIIVPPAETPVQPATNQTEVHTVHVQPDSGQ